MRRLQGYTRIIYIQMWRRIIGRLIPQLSNIIGWIFSFYDRCGSTEILENMQLKLCWIWDMRWKEFRNKAVHPISGISRILRLRRIYYPHSRVRNASGIFRTIWVSRRYTLSSTRDVWPSGGPECNSSSLSALKEAIVLFGENRTQRFSNYFSH